jgi:hypothetical protein
MIALVLPQIGPRRESPKCIPLDVIKTERQESGDLGGRGKGADAGLMIVRSSSSL